MESEIRHYVSNTWISPQPTACGLTGQSVPPNSCIGYPGKHITCAECLDSYAYEQDEIEYDLYETTQNSKPVAWMRRQSLSRLDNKEVNHVIGMLASENPGNTDEEAHKQWWERCWYFVGCVINHYPGFVMKLVRPLARQKPRGALFPVEAARLLNFRRALGLSMTSVASSANPIYSLPRDLAAKIGFAPIGHVQPCVDQDEYAQRIFEHQQTGQRLGQAMFNALHDLCPELANSIRGTDADCFHNDKLVAPFMQRAIGVFTDEEMLQGARHILKQVGKP